MDAAIPASGLGRTADTTKTATSTAPVVGAWVVLLGTAITTVGLSWDIQWHVEVGPDTFFTLSHLALYSGSALSGIASLVMVLMATSAQRAGREWPRWAGGAPVRVFGGVFSAPVGYLVSGVGAACFLLYGLLDLWWHSIYGFDAVLNTPSHVALFLSICITMVGAVIVFSAVRTQRWGRAGLLVSIPILITFSPIPFEGLAYAPLPVDPTLIGSMLCAPLLLIMGGLVLGRGGAVGISVVLAALQGALWWFSPWAAVTYAAAVGLPLRDGLTPEPPVLPSLIPMFLIASALVVEGAMWFSRARNVHLGRLMLPLGAVTGLLVGVTMALQLGLTTPQVHITAALVITLAICGIVLGIPAGFLGTRFGTMLRTTQPEDVA
ncbi:MAG TPA: hypothetical protein VGN81_41300 [Pseudonocardiaceae bacterium]